MDGEPGDYGYTEYGLAGCCFGCFAGGYGVPTLIVIGLLIAGVDDVGGVLFWPIVAVTSGVIGAIAGLFVSLLIAACKKRRRG